MHPHPSTSASQNSAKPRPVRSPTAPASPNHAAAMANASAQHHYSCFCRESTLALNKHMDARSRTPALGARPIRHDTQFRQNHANQAAPTEPWHHKTQCSNTAPAQSTVEAAR